jgi:hypothetical protein
MYDPNGYEMYQGYGICTNEESINISLEVLLFLRPCHQGGGAFIFINIYHISPCTHHRIGHHCSAVLFQSPNTSAIV